MSLKYEDIGCLTNFISTLYKLGLQEEEMIELSYPVIPPLGMEWIETTILIGAAEKMVIKAK